MCFACIGIALDYGVKVKMRLTESVHYLVAHLKTVLTDTGSHSHLNTVGTGALTDHLFHNYLGYASHRASPPGMSHGDYTRLGINQNDGDTIGCVYTDDYTLERCHEGINPFKSSLLLVNVHRAESLVDYSHTAGVGLSWHHEVIKVHAQLHGQSDPRIQHPQGIIAHIVT